MQSEARKTSWSQIGPEEQFFIRKVNSCFGSPDFYRKLESNLSILENLLKTKGKLKTHVFYERKLEKGLTTRVFHEPNRAEGLKTRVFHEPKRENH